jgi:hypothetical protein
MTTVKPFMRSRHALATLVVLTAIVGLVLWLAPSGWFAASGKLRPLGVPAHAGFAEKSQPAHWVDCVYKGASSQHNSYHCRVYTEVGGGRVAEGTYLLRQYRWDAAQQAPVFERAPLPSCLSYLLDGPGPVKCLSYESFDGVGIFLSGEQVLIPHGMIDYPLPDGHGRKQRYQQGEPLGDAQTY